MKLFPTLLAATLAFVASSTAVFAACPYRTVFTQYGSGCSPLAIAAPTLSGDTVPSSTGCGIRLVFSVSICCGTPTNQWLFAGIQSLSIPMQDGCTLLASPDVLVPLPATIGPTKVIADLPPTPLFVGATLFLQGAVERQWNGGPSLQFTNGLEMHFDP